MEYRSSRSCSRSTRSKKPTGVKIAAAGILGMTNRVLCSLAINIALFILGFVLGFSWLYVKVQGTADMQSVNLKLNQLQGLLNEQRLIDGQIDTCIKQMRDDFQRHEFDLHAH